MEEDLRALLLDAVAAEINWFVHPQGVALPGVVLNLVGGAEGITQSGPSGLWQAQVQIDAYADSASGAVGLGREIVDALHGFRGAGETGFFEGIFHTTTRIGREGGTNEADRPYRRSMDFDLNWRAI